MKKRSWKYLLLLLTIVTSIFFLFLISCKKEQKISVPVLTTVTTSDITGTSAVSGGTITDDGGDQIIARGVCWSTNQEPTIDNNITSNGTGIGSYTSNINGLIDGTHYFVRAYATNRAGTGYGDQRNFTTSGNLIATDFFPIAVWLQSPSNAIAYKDIGINMFVGLWNELDQIQLNKLRNVNIKVICSQNSFGLNNVNDTIIYGWMHGDEPDNAQWNAATKEYDPCIDPSVIINSYNIIKQNDPSRPVYLNLGQGVAYTNYVGRGACRNNTEMYKVSNNGYLKGCDIGSFDIYPVNNSDSETSGNLWYVAKGIDNLLNWSGNSIPVWCWIECTQIRAESSGKPSPSDVKSEVWMALIHGAKGFGYFCHSWYPAFDESALLHDPEMLQAVKAINTWVASLAHLLNSPNTADYATVNSSNTLVPVDFMTKNSGEENYIFAEGLMNVS